MLSSSRCTEKLAMKTTKTFSNAILYVLVACSLWTTASACPETHKSSSSEANNVMRRRYDSWLKRNGRKHRNKEEWEVRFAIYQVNVKFIELVNSQNHSYKLTDNRFADLTNDEFRSRHLGYRRQLPLQTGFRYQEHEDLHSELPKSIDWRKKGAVTHIKDQGKCGSCWAFSAVAAVEGIHKIKTGKLVTLSEQELIDCDISNGNEGCDGGDMETAFTFIRKQGGLATEKDYPYQGSDDICNRVKARKHAVSISGYENVPARKENLLKAAVAHQPVSVAIDAGGYAFQLYSRGIFSGSCGKDLNHGVTIVGYGEEKGDKFWLVKNSWATDWGESGYIRMKRDTRDKDGACGIAMDASYPVKH